MWPTILSALIPVGVEGLKQGLSALFGGPKATTIAEQLQLDQSEVERIKALAELDKPIGQPSQWVVDLRASCRYVGALSVIAAGIALLWIPGVNPTVQAIGLEGANVAFGFLFGSRIVSTFKGLNK